MVFPRASGILFTAILSLLTGRCYPLMQASDLVKLLSPALVNADNYKVRNGSVTDKKISAKKLAIYA
jgi:pyruvate,water dikinase